MVLLIILISEEVQGNTFELGGGKVKIKKITVWWLVVGYEYTMCNMSVHCALTENVLIQHTQTP